MLNLVFENQTLASWLDEVLNFWDTLKLNFPKLLERNLLQS